MAVTHSDSEESTHQAAPKIQAKADAVNDGAQSGDEEEGEEGSEYEIEEVLDAKRGYFPDGRMGYYVKWKGYGQADNSWVDEIDAENAKDLVDEFWRKNPQKKRTTGRKSVDKKASPKKGRKSAPPDESSDAGELKTKKRGRKSVSQKVESEDEMDVEPTEKRAPKKARKNSTQISKAIKKRTETPEEEERVIGNMRPYMHLSDWEGLVKSVDTVERQDDNKLFAYFTLQTGEVIMEKTEVCRERFPQKLFDFYESNLKWRTMDDDL